MPILLDDPNIFNNLTAPKTQSPKFFSSALTGNGKSSGLLNAMLRPGRYSLGESRNTVPIDTLNNKVRNSQSSVTQNVIPFGILTPYSIRDNLSRGLTLELPVEENLHKLTEGFTKLSFDAYYGLTPQGMIVQEDGSGDKTVRSCRTLYRQELFIVPVGTDIADLRLPIVDGSPVAINQGFTLVDWSFAPLDDAAELIEAGTRRFTNSGGALPYSEDDLGDWMANYDLHERISDLATDWSNTAVSDVLVKHLEELFAAGIPDNDVLNRLASQLRYLETYNVSLDAYRAIHAAFDIVCPPDIATALSKQNLNLMMNHSLDDLSTLKPQLFNLESYATAITNAGQQLPQLPARMSSQQRAAITTLEPLVIVQAGAGTGKSTSILERIEYVCGLGVSPKDVLVLSFTNAAADNIKEKNPNVGSMTIARMIHDIYAANFPNHELSSMDTILNSLDIFFAQDDTARAFRRRLWDVKKNQAGATTALNAFIERYRTHVVHVLDTIGQTCLELEIIIAQQLIDSLNEPAHIGGKYIIIDEVQDNSIFEFIYSLKYVAKHRANLYIVGDASQTLFEFRSANPKALNALESSGVFEAFQLTTNYRSNQAILDFANRTLQEIEANQFAKIQLRANSLAPITAKEFTEKIHLDYRVYSSEAKFKKDLPALLMNVVKSYIDAHLAAGEAVAFVAHTRDTVRIIQETLTTMYPNQPIANLTNERSFDSTVFSDFIKAHWDEILQVPNLAHASLAVVKSIDSNMSALTRGREDTMRVPIMNMVQKWWLENSSSINAWVAQAGNGQLTSDQFFTQLRQSLLDFEIRNNSIRQSLNNQRKEERKKQNAASNAKLIVSTIHGAKGLEFDNVVVMHKFDSQMNEENKRMYYVAMTRAKKTEFILSHGSIKKPKIEADYDIIVEALHYQEQLVALRKQGVNPDTMSDDDVEAALAHLEQQAQDAAERGDLDAAASMLPAVVDYATRGMALPEENAGAAPIKDIANPNGDDGDADDSSPFTAAVAASA